MIIALYLPDEIAEQFKVDHLQATLHRLRRLSEKLHRIGTEVDGECLLYTDVKFMRQLEASFCVAREVDRFGDVITGRSGFCTYTAMKFNMDKLVEV